MTRPVALWLERRLNFPNWTEESIGAMPETRIGDWARANGVAMDPLYATEQREGGTPALGTGIPAPSREALCVFSREEWERRKHQLIHEAWLKAGWPSLPQWAASERIPLQQPTEITFSAAATLK